MSPEYPEMQKAGPSTRVTVPRSPPASDALTLVLHGCGMLYEATATVPMLTPRKAHADHEDRRGRSPVVSGTADRLRRHRAHRVVARRWAGRARTRRDTVRQRRVGDEGRPRDTPARPTRPGAARQRVVRHVPFAVRLSGRGALRRDPRPLGHRRARPRRASLRSTPGRAHAARSVDGAGAALLCAPAGTCAPRGRQRSAAIRLPGAAV